MPTICFSISCEGYELIVIPIAAVFACKYFKEYLLAKYEFSLNQLQSGVQVVGYNNKHEQEMQKINNEHTEKMIDKEIENNQLKEENNKPKIVRNLEVFENYNKSSE